MHGQLSIFQEDNIIEDFFDIADQMRGDQNDCVFGIVVQDNIENQFACRRIDSAYRLVQHIDPGFAAHDQTQLKFLLHALGH